LHDDRDPAACRPARAGPILAGPRRTARRSTSQDYRGKSLGVLALLLGPSGVPSAAQIGAPRHDRGQAQDRGRGDGIIVRGPDARRRMRALFQVPAPPMSASASDRSSHASRVSVPSPTSWARVLQAMEVGTSSSGHALPTARFPRWCAAGAIGQVGRGTELGGQIRRTWSAVPQLKVADTLIRPATPCAVASIECANGSGTWRFPRTRRSAAATRPAALGRYVTCSAGAAAPGKRAALVRQRVELFRVGTWLHRSRPSPSCSPARSPDLKPRRAPRR
jgi:hypothetical protein